MDKALLEAIYEALPKKHLAAYYGEPAANVAAYKYLLNHYDDKEQIATHLAKHHTGYVEYDTQYTKVLNAYLNS